MKYPFLMSIAAPMAALATVALTSGASDGASRTRGQKLDTAEDAVGRSRFAGNLDQ